MGHKPADARPATDPSPGGDPREAIDIPVPAVPTKPLDKTRDYPDPNAISIWEWNQLVENWVGGQSAKLSLMQTLADLLRLFNDIFVAGMTIEEADRLARLRDDILGVQRQIQDMDNEFGRSPWEYLGIRKAPFGPGGDVWGDPWRPGEGDTLRERDPFAPQVTNINYVVSANPRETQQQGRAPSSPGQPAQRRRSDSPPATPRSSGPDREPRATSSAPSSSSSSPSSPDAGPTKKPDTDKGKDPKKPVKGLAPDDPMTGQGGPASADDVGGRIKVPTLPRVTQLERDLVGPFVKEDTGAADENRPATTSPSAGRIRDSDDLEEDLPGQISTLGGPPAGNVPIEDPRPLNPVDPAKT